MSAGILATPGTCLRADGSLQVRQLALDAAHRLLRRSGALLGSSLRILPGLHRRIERVRHRTPIARGNRCADVRACWASACTPCGLHVVLW